MTRKSNFINSLRNVFRKKHSNAQVNITVKESSKDIDVKKVKGKSVYRRTKNQYKFGGCSDRNMGAIYYPPSRGKIKGYMKNA